jgi:hypothetical protein
VSDLVAGSAAAHLQSPPDDAPPRAGAVAVIVNPVTVHDVDNLTAQIAHRCAELGLLAPSVLPTTEKDPGWARPGALFRRGRPC